MKTKNVAVGFLFVIMIVGSMAMGIASRPAGSLEQSQLCNFDPRHCSIPHSVNGFSFFPR